MRRSGRVNIILVLGLASIVVLIGLLFFTKSSPTTAVGNFFTALAKADIDKLVDLSYYPEDKAKLRSQWEFATKEAAPHFRFTWRIAGAKEIDSTHASVNVQWTKNLFNGGYEERYEVPCVKVNGEWKVDVVSIARDMYPALPR